MKTPAAIKNLIEAPRSLSWQMPTATEVQPHCEGAFLSVPTAVVAQGRSAGFSLKGARRWLALFRHNPYWIRPAYGTDTAALPVETQFLLWEREDGRYGVLLPLPAGDLRATLQGEEKGFALVWDGTAPDATPQDATLAFAAVGDDPFVLVRAAVATVAARLKTFRLREEKKTPGFMQWLGWCTWDAFYQSVNERKVLVGLRSFKEGGIQPGFVILDDGWLRTRGDFLVGFGADPEKFPHGLAPLVQRAKSEFGVREFGIWHAFQGYWGGVDPNGELASEYELLANEGNIRPWEAAPRLTPLSAVHPRDIHRFYHDFYRGLQEIGISFTKVDGQSALEKFSEGKLGRVSTMQSYQEALQGASNAHMKGDVIHCMSNGSDAAYQLQATNMWRNSDDYFPARPNEVQQLHIHMNTMNNLWTGTFSYPDWDMFQSYQKEAPYHAASRAISGGPIYLCDKPNQQNFELIGKLCLSDGRVLISDRPALPARDCLFVSCYREPKLLKITNHTGAIGVLGVFHCQKDGGTIEDSFSPADVPELNEKAYVAFRYSDSSLQHLKLKEKSRITLPQMGWEIVTISPVRNGVAVLGLIEKLNPAAAVTRLSSDERQTVAELRDGGVVGLYCETAPVRVRVNGKTARFRYDVATKLLRLNAPTGQAVTVVVDVE